MGKYEQITKVRKLLEWLKTLEYDHIQVLQTIFRKPEKITALEPIRDGYGEGLFVVISAQKEETISRR